MRRLCVCVTLIMPVDVIQWMLLLIIPFRISFVPEVSCNDDDDDDDDDDGCDDNNDDDSDCSAQSSLSTIMIIIMYDHPYYLSFYLSFHPSIHPFTYDGWMDMMIHLPTYLSIHSFYACMYRRSIPSSR